MSAFARHCFVTAHFELHELVPAPPSPGGEEDNAQSCALSACAKGIRASDVVMPSSARNQNPLLQHRPILTTMRTALHHCRAFDDTGSSTSDPRVADTTEELALMKVHRSGREPCAHCWSRDGHGKRVKDMKKSLGSTTGEGDIDEPAEKRCCW